jgi:hypothetical protein
MAERLTMKSVASEYVHIIKHVKLYNIQMLFIELVCICASRQEYTYNICSKQVVYF